MHQSLDLRSVHVYLPVPSRRLTRDQIHLDQYKMRLYDSLNTALSYDGSGQGLLALCGFQCGNRHQPGCLTSNSNVRLHSCERDMDCPGLESAHVVFITPIVAHLTNGTFFPDIGAGGGEEDLIQTYELELEDANAVTELNKLCSENIRDEETLEKTLNLISNAFKSVRKTLSLGFFKPKADSDIMSLKELADLFSSGVLSVSSMHRHKGLVLSQDLEMKGQKKSESEDQLPKEIVRITRIHFRLGKSY